MNVHLKLNSYYYSPKFFTKDFFGRGYECQVSILKLGKVLINLWVFRCSRDAFMSTTPLMFSNDLEGVACDPKDKTFMTQRGTYRL